MGVVSERTVLTMRDRLIELLKQADFDYSEECTACLENGYKAIPKLEEFFADHLLANGVIVPPCKVGDTVQEIANACGISRQAVHRRIKSAGQTMRRDFIDQDITFCSNRKCQRKGCKRHHFNADWSVKQYHSFADFTGTQYCPKVKGGVNNG